jgi:hypothetical protein
MEKQAGPVHHADTGTHGVHDRKGKLTMHCIIGFCNINNDQGTGKAKRMQDVGQKGSEGDIISYETATQVRGLLRPNHRLQSGVETCCNHFS